MALLTVRHRRFPGVRLKPHHCHNFPAERWPQAFGTSGQIGAMAELSLTLLLRLLTRPTPRHSGRNIILTMTHGTGGTVSPASGWRNAGSTVSISATPTNNTQVSYSFAVGLAAAPVLTLAQTIRLQSQ